MAIIMLTTGSLPAKKFYVGQCTTCKSTYRAQREDLTYECDYRESGYISKCQFSGCSATVYFVEER
jgi:hypothetical protein